MNLKLQIDAGELEALCLAKEIHAAAVLMDDRAGRIAAVQCGLAVVGTIGLFEAAAMRGWIDLARAVAKLRTTNARLNSALIEAALARDAARKKGD
ncbi:MAG: hypothetical protein QOD03_766 [Verrucomicrobiota bacterium]